MIMLQARAICANHGSVSCSSHDDLRHDVDEEEKDEEKETNDEDEKKSKEK